MENYVFGRNNVLELLKNESREINKIILMKGMKENSKISQILNIAKENLKEELVDFYDGNNFLGECYLKILTEQKGNFEDLFWYFSVTGQNNEVLNIVISVESGEVLVE